MSVVHAQDGLQSSNATLHPGFLGQLQGCIFPTDGSELFLSLVSFIWSWVASCSSLSPHAVGVLPNIRNKMKETRLRDFYMREVATASLDFKNVSSSSQGVTLFQISQCCENCQNRPTVTIGYRGFTVAVSVQVTSAPSTATWQTQATRGVTFSCSFQLLHHKKLQRTRTCDLANPSNKRSHICAIYRPRHLVQRSPGIRRQGLHQARRISKSLASWVLGARRA